MTSIETEETSLLGYKGSGVVLVDQPMVSKPEVSGSYVCLLGCLYGSMVKWQPR